MSIAAIQGGGFTAGTPISTGGQRSTSVAVADFTADGLTDVAVVLGTSLSGNAPFGGVRILSGDGTGGLTPQNVEYAVGAAPTDSVSADFNGDGLADLITLATTSGGNLLWRRTNISNNGEMRQKSYPGWFTPESLEIVVDLNSNDEPELATYGSSTSGRKMWLIDDATTGLRSSSPINLPTDFIQ